MLEDKIQIEESLTELRSLKDGDWYITPAELSRYNTYPEKVMRSLRQRTTTAFWSLTSFGTRVSSLPSELVYPVRRLDL